MDDLESIWMSLRQYQRLESIVDEMRSILDSLPMLADLNQDAEMFAIEN